MKNSMKKFALILLSLCLVLSAWGKKADNSATEGADTNANSASENSENNASEDNAAAGKYTAGTYTGEGEGFGGTVTVTLTVDENAITAVEINAESETPAVGGAAAEELKEQVLAAGSAEIDGVSGATLTSNAVKAAVTDALNQAMGIEATTGDKKAVADGTYTAKTPGFGVMKEMELSVTFAGNKITDITTVCAGSATQADEDEYSPIYETVEKYLFPRIIESQSIAVDSITGATVSSNAAKTIIAKVIDENGGDSSEWREKPVKSTEEVVLNDYDVVVVGLGTSGVATYLSAAENGATVFGMDSAAKIGGNGTNTAGPMGVNPARQVENNGGNNFVDPDELFNAWMEYTENDAKPELVKLFINESGETFGWLEDNYDFQFLDGMFAFYDVHGWPLWTMYGGKNGGSKDVAYLNSMEKATAMNEKNKYMTELTAKSLIVEDGKVVGVEAEYYDGTVYKVYGDSVVLADGGYIGNAEMTQKYTGAVWHTKGMTQCNGFGISEGLKLGGALFNEDVAVEDHIANLDTIIRSDDYSNDDKSILASLVQDMSYTFIKSNGDAFDPNYNGLGISFNAWEAGANYYVLINEDEYNAIKTTGLNNFVSPMFFNQGGAYEAGTPVENIDDIMAMGEKYNDVIVADSLDDLSSKLGFKVNVSDIHGKADGKVYCIKGAAYVYSTCGGLDIDTKCNLLKEDGSAVDNVYVVGNNSLGVLNKSNKAYVTYGGAAQGWALTSGRLVGKDAAAKYAK